MNAYPEQYPEERFEIVHEGVLLVAYQDPIAMKILLPVLPLAPEVPSGCSRTVRSRSIKKPIVGLDPGIPSYNRSKRSWPFL